MDGSHKPRIFTLFFSDDGFGLYHEALPAGKYWTHQFNSTPEMTKEHTKPMETGKPTTSSWYMKCSVLCMAGLPAKSFLAVTPVC